jgi:hypothetical protein
MKSKLFLNGQPPVSTNDIKTCDGQYSCGDHSRSGSGNTRNCCLHILKRVSCCIVNNMRVCMCVYVCVCVYIYIYIYIYVYIYVCMYVCMYVCVVVNCFRPPVGGLSFSFKYG